MLKQKLIKNRICSLILIDELDNIFFDAYSIRFEDLFDYREKHFWELEDGTFAWGNLQGYCKKAFPVHNPV